MIQNMMNIQINKPDVEKSNLVFKKFKQGFTVSKIFEIQIDFQSNIINILSE